ncbi:preprotein translocase subunit SecY [Candidatus Pantoea edessiphila]|uniref:Protein translocase subunit SecY n=1 Tax=Candidatus Pantoea edessiphila TaxID=2044610 RepID=A0A2P5SZZ9_9GAMM|nr:preprotein translocase subunit SecY [Candidatus Pantoea edessiphila]PPI87880.1 preprotein translocase subunit SecY [Candidatus Pantoea edessiphila]
MTKHLGLDFKNTKNSLSQLKYRLLFLLLSLIVFRIGSFIPIPGIDAKIFTKILEQQRGTIIDMFNMFSGGSLSRASIFALGIMPYVSASIVIQLLTIVHPSLSEVKKEGEAGRRKINKYTRYCTLILAIIQSIGIATGLPNMLGVHNLLLKPSLPFYITAIISLVTGTIFLMWLGEQITEKGIGNGISIIIFAGIIAGLPPAIGHTIEQARQGELHVFLLLLILLFIFAITYFVIFIERGHRRILANYAKRQQGRRMYAAQCTHLPLKVNMAGVIPAIFASSIILFPATMASWFGNNNHCKWLTTVSLYLQPGRPFYVLIYASAIIFFCFFYTALVFNPRETADNLKKSGAFIPGIRPGEQTAKYINKVMTRLTLVGAFYITFICLVPEFMRIFMKVPFYFGGTSLLIVVVVIMDFMSQIQTLMMTNQYDLALKKANLKGSN